MFLRIPIQLHTEIVFLQKLRTTPRLLLIRATCRNVSYDLAPLLRIEYYMKPLTLSALAGQSLDSVEAPALLRPCGRTRRKSTYK